MSKLTKKQKQQIINIFTGKARNVQTKDARIIAEVVEVPRRTVMEFLEYHGYTTYSPGSYR